MKKLFFLILLLPLTYVSSQEDAEIFKEELRSFYSPPDCFLLTFRTDVNIPQAGTQTVDGTVRADNLNRRIRVVLVEPNLSLTVSWITVIKETAYLTHPRKEGVLRLPLQEVTLGSVVNNQIQIPFSLFRNILFGKLPEELLASPDWRMENNRWIGSYYSGQSGNEKITFYFHPEEKHRIQKIEYYKPESSYYATVTFNGKFYQTKYPRSLRIQTYQNQKPLESITIHFSRYLDTVKCKDEHFPVM